MYIDSSKQFFLKICYHWQFRDTMSQQRSNACKRVRREAASAIFNCTDKDLETSKTRFEKFSVLIGWTTKDNKTFYNPMAPILYEDDNGEKPCYKAFRNPILLKVSPFFFRLFFPSENL
jgi:hypothetical protein